MLIGKRDERRDYWQNFFQTIFANLEEILIAADANSGKIEYISPNAERILGVRQEKEGAAAQTLNRIGLIPTPDLTILRSQKERELECYLTNIQTGETLWCKTCWSFLQTYGELGETLIINISERSRERACMDRIQEDLREAKRTSAAKSRFLTTISHDMRTPMNAIMGLTDLAIEHMEEQERVRDYLQRISRASTHLLELVNDVLDMERIESGRLTMERKAFGMTEMLQDVADLIHAEASVKAQLMGTEWKLEHNRVMGDPVRIRQVLINILSNAVKYTQRGGKLLFQLKEIHSTDALATYMIKVYDNGYGMSETFQQILFEPFAKEHSAESEGVEGTGLGMSITKSLVDLMGGELSVESRLGEGTIVTVNLTLELAAQEWTEFGSSEKTSAAWHCKGRHILLVEDNEITADVLKDILELMEAQVRWARNGQQAVEIIAEEGSCYDLILMDIQMPVMDGYEATRRIRKMAGWGRDIPIIALTGNAFMEDIKASREAGMNCHLSKPIKKNELEQVLRAILDD